MTCLRNEITIKDRKKEIEVCQTQKKHKYCNKTTIIHSSLCKLLQISKIVGLLMGTHKELVKSAFTCLNTEFNVSGLIGSIRLHVPSMRLCNKKSGRVGSSSSTIFSSTSRFSSSFNASSIFRFFYL